jgi:hypothetical protein
MGHIKYISLCVFCSSLFCLVSTEAAKSKGGQNVSTYFWESVNKTSVNKTAYVGSLKVNHSSETGRFIIGQIQLPIAGSCSVANASFNVVDYTNYTRKFTELLFIDYVI